MKNLGEKFRESVVWELVRTAYSQGIHFILSVILARLLTPTDFGLVAMAYVVLRIAQIFSDVGFSSALIQDEKANETSYSSVFWINLMMGIIFFLLIQVLAWPFGDFYNEYALVPIIRILGFVFLLDALSQVQATLLRKNLDFRTINRIVIVSETISGTAAIAAAFAGWGVWSLVLQTVVYAFLNLIFYWTSSKWRPSWGVNWNEGRRLFSFGAYVFFGQLISRISLRVDTLLLGKMFSPATLGFYNRADSLLSLVKKYSSSSIVKVALPYFSQLKKDERKFLSKYRELMQIVYFAIFLVSGLLFFAGQDLIVFLYGSQWTTAGGYLQIIAFTIFFHPANAIMNNVLLSKGFSRGSFNMGLVAVLIRIIASVITILLFHDIFYFLYAQVAISFVLNFGYMASLSHYIKIKLKDQLNPFLVAGCLFIISASCSFAIISVFGIKDTLYGSVIGSAAFITVFIMLNLIFNLDVLKTLYLNAYSLIKK